ncbi:hypothetical protein FM038_017720 [Shewanella eurypsychrophilus]|uniref:Lipoprotein n=1 Tax=Shewanella eurypsychrophilus TaxID=2593656 RepID=A0ABX6VB41_9GAMM|nr:MULTISPECIES: hypothetical protein [Shewanella]QFU23821.1 hypothetical protein FS418_19495 [Shewanella sp. YLB-09]QPG59043.1 hypothetical protein FM038_017720 [Shewanella eurypsychrophilus]
MKPLIVLLSLSLLLLSGCASKPDEALYCGVVSGYLEPDQQQDLYRAVVTHLDGKPVISKPNYRLSPGEYTFTFAELISSPSLKVKLAARVPKTLTINVETNIRYHFAAKFNTDKRYRGNDSGFWQPEIWLEEPQECELAVK